MFVLSADAHEANSVIEKVIKTGTATNAYRDFALV